MIYTANELDNAALADLLNDARCSEEQAVTGPFWPDRGITAESLLAYAAKCRTQAEKYRNGGAHKAILQPAYGEMCRKPEACTGKGYCPLDPTCAD